MGCCIATKVLVQDDARKDDGRDKDEVNGNFEDGVKDVDCSKCFLEYLPTELLVKILSYLPTRDILMMRYASRRFTDISEIPLLWKDFIWPNCEPYHSLNVSNMLKTWGAHVRRITIPAHVRLTAVKALEMAHCCTMVKHLSLSKTRQLSLDHLKEILSITHLQQLDLCIDDRFMLCTQQHSLSGDKFIEGLLRVTATRVRKLKLQINNYDYSVHAVASMKKWANDGNPLPLTVNILTAISNNRLTLELLPFWSELSFKPLPFEICLYDNKRIPMNLYPPMPISKFRFGPSATSPLIRLRDHGIIGLEDDMFYLSEYDHYGVVRYTITPTSFKCDRYGIVRRTVIPFGSELYESLIEKSHFNHINHLHSVSCVDLSHSNINSDHLEQLAVVCPNLQRLNLKENIRCLRDLRGFKNVIHACQNLVGLNLAGISQSSVESYLILWKLLLSLKRLTHLAIDLCLLKPDDAYSNKCKLINMLKSCHSLQALELHCGRWCSECSSTSDFLFSHFPSLTHCRMSNFRYSGLKYAITKCRKLKHLYEEYAYEQCESLLPLSNICHIQQLYINSVNATYFNVTDELMHALSAHGGLECVVLHTNNITISSIITLIKNSPNLVLLHLSSKQSPYDWHYPRFDYTDRIKSMFVYHKLFSIGSFKAKVVIGSLVHVIQDTELFDTDLNSLWI